MTWKRTVKQQRRMGQRHHCHQRKWTGGNKKPTRS